MPTRKQEHVIVIGAGIIGTCAALELIDKGFQVSLIETGRPGGTQAASYGNGAMLSTASTIPLSVPGLWKNLPSYLLATDGPLVIRWRDIAYLTPWLIRFLLAGATFKRMARISNALAILLRDGPQQHQALAIKAGVAELVTMDGIIYAWKTRADFLAEARYWDLRKSQGICWDDLSAQELAALEPDLSPDYTFAVHVKSAARCTDPGSYVAALASLVEARGGKIINDTVRGIEVATGKLQSVRLDSGIFACDKVVVCAGMASRELAASVGDHVPMIPERGYHVQFDDASIGPRHAFMPMDGKMANVVLRGGLRAAGQVELCHPDAPPNWRRAEILKHHLLQTFPKLDPNQCPRFWFGSRPSLPDGLPVISASSSVNGIYYGFGHGHIGLSAAPKTAKILTAIISGEPSDAESALFSIKRF